MVRPRIPLGRVLLKLEELQEQHIATAMEPEKKKEVELSEEEHKEAMALLMSDNLMDRIIGDFELAGLVGESDNALVAYLAAVSRRMDDPLAVIIQSSSSAGKSSLMDAILAFMPDEDQIRYTAMTGQSLFYMGETELAHKILAISEEEGVEQAGYALKILQSEKKLRIASTGKDAKTGRLVTQEYMVEGPVMLLLTTTSPEVDEELQNRCLVLTINENREQTRRIHEIQRQSHTMEGMLRREDRKRVIRAHRNAQRLIRPLMVVNPYADQLTFVDSRLRTRRDNLKYLNIIKAVALMHQYQRKVHTVRHDGESIAYIEVMPEDIEIANRLAARVMGTSLDDLAPQTRRLLMLILELADRECDEQDIERRDLRLSRRQIREHTGWGNTQLGIHLQRLVDMEYVVTHRGRGRQYLYELVYKGEGMDGERFILDLVDPETLDYDDACTGSKDQCTPHKRPANAPDTPHVRNGNIDASPSESMDNASERQQVPEKDYSDAQLMEIS